MPPTHYPLTLSERERVQVIAALRFWESVAEHSRTHPMNHPAVSGMFTDVAPLDDNPAGWQLLMEKLHARS